MLLWYKFFANVLLVVYTIYVQGLVSPGPGVRALVPGAPADHMSGRGEAGGGCQAAVCPGGGQGGECAKVCEDFAITEKADINT